MQPTLKGLARFPRVIRGALVPLIASVWALEGHAQADMLDAFFSDLPTDPEELADRIILDVAEIRGLEFQQDISVSSQSREEFETFLATEMDRSMPPDRARVFGRVVNKLGLYNGPIIEDSVALITMLATTQAAAYYNPEQSAFYVLVSDAPMIMLAPLYAHELYHGLQDQHWDLNAYVLDGLEDGLNDDEMLARQAVVEGEATYIMTLWLMQKVTGQLPSGFVLDLAVNMQAQLDSGALRELAATQMLPGMLSDDVQASLDAMDDIPAFLIESLLGVYLKGMGFVHQAVREGWENADTLYTDPPRSTEQILHAEKWLQQRDDPTLIDFPETSDGVLENWALLDTNVIGEFQWRIIFNEFGLDDRSDAAAAGWDGDRYAVFERDDELLLLLYTRWDSEGEATEFARAYEELLVEKYPGGNEAIAVERRGADVLIVEGGSAADTGDFIDWLANAAEIREAAR